MVYMTSTHWAIDGHKFWNSSNIFSSINLFEFIWKVNHHHNKRGIMLINMDHLINNIQNYFSSSSYKNTKFDTTKLLSQLLGSPVHNIFRTRWIHTYNYWGNNIIQLLEWSKRSLVINSARTCWQQPFNKGSLLIFRIPNGLHTMQQL